MQESEHDRNDCESAQKELLRKEKILMICERLSFVLAFRGLRDAHRRCRIVAMGVAVRLATAMLQPSLRLFLLPALWTKRMPPTTASMLCSVLPAGVCFHPQDP